MPKKSSVDAAAVEQKSEVTVDAAQPAQAPKTEAAPKAKAARKAKAAPKAKAAAAEEIIVQFGGEEWKLADLKEKIAAAYVAEGHRWGTVKALTLYVKPEERKVYYVINGKTTGSVDL